MNLSSNDDNAYDYDHLYDHVYDQGYDDDDDDERGDSGTTGSLTTTTMSTTGTSVKYVSVPTDDSLPLSVSPTCRGSSKLANAQIEKSPKFSDIGNQFIHFLLIPFRIFSHGEIYEWIVCLLFSERRSSSSSNSQISSIETRIPKHFSNRTQENGSLARLTG